MTTKPIKSLGQNFLLNNDVSRKMIEELKLANNDKIVEIGGGEGAITLEIASVLPKTSSLMVFEIDQRLVKTLTDKTRDYPGVSILNENFLDSDINSMTPTKVIGAIPYYITSPIIHKLLKMKKRPETIVLLIQEEVADKIIEGKSGSSYWSNVVLGYNAVKAMRVGAKNFNPAPKVKSAIIVLNRNESDEKLMMEIGFDRWSRFLHMCYQHPRKMLNKVFDEKTLSQIGVQSTDRPHNVGSHKWLELYNLTKTND